MTVSQKAFADVLIQAFQYFGELRPIYLDEESFRLSVPGEDHAFWIGNLFLEFHFGGGDECEEFLASAWRIWSQVQDELPAQPHWIPEMIRPFRDETHPLSYRVEMTRDERLWAVVPPFDEQAGQREFERYELADAYSVWWDHQFQRACKKHLKNIYHWLTYGQITEDELRLLSELRRIWRQGRLLNQGGNNELANELCWLGVTTELPPNLREFLRRLPESFDSVRSAIDAFRQLRVDDYQ